MPAGGTGWRTRRAKARHHPALSGTLAWTNQQAPAHGAFQSGVGTQYIDPLAGHHQDRVILGTSCGQLGDDYAAEEQALGNGTPDYERVLDLGRRIPPIKLACVQPDIE